MTELIVEIRENKYMLRLGDNDDKSDLKIQDVTGKLEEFDIFFEIKNEDDVKRLKKIFHAEGGSVKKLAWHFNSEYVMSAVDVVEMLNCFDKLEMLELSSFDVKFKGDCCDQIHLPNIKCLEISYCDNFIIDFLKKNLPDNSIPELTISNVKDIEDKLDEFIKKQTSIKRLTLYNDLTTIEPFKLLNLESLRCPIRHDDENMEQQREFLSYLIKSQVNLKKLDLLTDSDHMFSFVNDEMFADICALSKLENLSINIEGMTPKGITAISHLSALKTLKMKAAFENKTKSKMLKEFSAVQNSTIENLIFKLWFDVADKSIEAIGENFKNLKSLTIIHGTHQRFSLFAKSFPNLEKLNINFGDVNRTVTFDQVYDINDNVTMPKLKTLILSFSGKTDKELLLKFLAAFPSLEKLEIDSEFQLTSDFINRFANNLTTIKSVKLLHFDIGKGETFSTDLIDALKFLRSKLDYISVLLRYTHKINKVNDDFTYTPIIDELKDTYKLKKSNVKHVHIHKKLMLEAGKNEECEDED